jgi:CubicO group peptidase (beta-lactamase class C family)
MQSTALRITNDLIDQKPLISEICKVTGAPGLAIGVIHEGEFIYEDYYGYRDVQAKLKPDRETVFFVASLAKAMTAAAVGMLVDDGAMKWTTPVHEILPEMSRTTILSQVELSVLDLLSHRTGATWADALYL